MFRTSFASDHLHGHIRASRTRLEMRAAAAVSYAPETADHAADDLRLAIESSDEDAGPVVAADLKRVIG